ncbi:hypothetical protein BC831DRAFT_455955 [Entophlyctis helioformis]|nr:hypothetical protein BC831DRAFT_455955 [Entophlyctis helioformis]
MLESAAMDADVQFLEQVDALHRQQAQQGHDSSAGDGLAKEFDGAEFFFRMMKDTFVARFQGDRPDELQAGRGQVCPDDDDRTDVLDIRRLLLAQPGNTEPEMKFHKELFSKLKFNYLEQDAKEKFLRRVLDTVPVYASQAAVKALEQSNAQQKETLKANKANLEELKAEVSDLADHLCAAYDRVQTRKEEALSIEQDISRLEADVKVIEATANPRTATIAQLEQKTSTQQDKLADLRRQVQAQQKLLADHRAKRAQLNKDVTRLEAKKSEAEANAAEAMRISQSKDPQVEELGQWYTDTIAILYKCSGVRHIRPLTDSNMEIVYALDDGNDDDNSNNKDGTTSTVIVRIVPDPNAVGGHAVEAQVVDSHVPLGDILAAAAAHFPKLDHALSYTVRAVYARLMHLHARHREMRALVAANDDVMYDAHTGEVMVHVPASGRTFVVMLDASYPRSAWQGIRVVGVEPAEADDEVGVWQNKIAQIKPASFTELVQHLA